MRARLAAVAVTAGVLLTACTPGGDDPGPSGAAAAAKTCPTPEWNAVELRRVQVHPLDAGGPMVDRVLRATRATDGDLCLEIVIDHADPGATAVSYRIVARQGSREWRAAGKDPDGQLPLRVDRRGCVVATGELAVLGADDRAHRYRARLRVDCAGAPAAP